MQIKNTQAHQQYINNNNKNKKQNFKGIGQMMHALDGRKVLSTFANPDSLATTIAIESCVTTGRSVNAYKRGGKHELRERLLDDVTSAIFWMGGVDIFNKIGDKFGEKVLKLPITEFDVGKDALRDPFKNVAGKVKELATDSQTAEALTSKLAKFKFAKIVTSTILATAFVGFGLPKINQFITKSIFAKNKMDEVLNYKPENKYSILQSVNIENFGNNAQVKNKPAFKGDLTTVANLLENNRICKMLTSDAGILTGRVTTARNKDEAIEYAFRDSVSPFFYYASTPLIYKGLQKLTDTVGITSLDPIVSKQMNEVMINQLQGGTMNVEEFAKKTIGTLSDGAKRLIEQLPFESDVIAVDKLVGKIDNTLMEKAKAMAGLQPEISGIGKVLTKQQVADVLKEGAINTPEFMQQAYKSKFGDALTNPFKYISMKKITKFRTEMDKYAQDIIKAAKNKNNGVVDANLLNSMNKKGFAMSAGFRVFAMAVSAIFLGIIIPKAQYAITAKRTGSAAAPGLREFDEGKNA